LIFSRALTGRWTLFKLQCPSFLSPEAGTAPTSRVSSACKPDRSGTHCVHMCGASQEVRELAKIIADWSASAPDFTFYFFGSRVRGDHRSDSDVDLYCKTPPNPSHESTTWWTNQNCVEEFESLRKALSGLIKWLEAHAPLLSQVKQGKVAHRDRNVVCVWLPPKPDVMSVVTSA
jgi:predicted nucleotidyltransferase